MVQLDIALFATSNTVGFYPGDTVEGVVNVTADSETKCRHASLKRL